MDESKRAAAEAASRLVEDGMRVGLGTGSTVAFLLPALAARGLDIRCVATSVATATEGAALGLRVEPFDRLDRLDIAIDGADQVTPDRWLVKGAGGAHTREKIVAAAADRFVVIVGTDKLVDRITAPIPLELLTFGLAATLRALGGRARVRAGCPPSPDAGIIADWMGDIDDVEQVAASLAATPGVVDHGIFEPALVHDVIVGRPANSA